MGENTILGNKLRRDVQETTTTRWFWGFVIGHLVFWTLLPTLVNSNAPLDCIEMLYWGHEWQWGYYKHPPLPAWCCEMGRVIFGNVDWPLYLASQLCVVTCFWAAWKMARQCLSAWPALGATVILEACYYFSFASIEMNNNMVAKACWALAILALYFAIQTTQKRYWVATGFALAMAALAKYDVGLLLLSMLGFSVIHPRGRQCWRTPGPYLLALTAGICVAPHLVWLVENDFLTVNYFRNRSASSSGLSGHLFHPLQFAVSQLLSLAPVLLLATGVLGWHWQRRVLDRDDRLTRDYLLAVVLGPAVLAMLFSLLTGAKLRSMWGSAMWTYCGVLLLLLFQSNASVSEFRKLFQRAVSVGIVLAIIYTSKLTLIATYTNRPSRIHFPGRDLAQEVQQRWQRVTGDPLTIVGGDWWLAGNVAFYAGTPISVYPELQTEWSPWTSHHQMRQTGGVVLWDAGDAAPLTYSIRPAWAEAFPEAEMQPVIELAWDRVPNADPIHVGIAIIPPAARPASIANALPNINAPLR
ncbi:hypothetical protein Pla52o_25500 [Novipirellula galeiformis]|uniref:Glycosyltransferase RgtA/B/C/D-like domain-containing protein n=1 Tax=Novipirellula galeiformis TaxID=2528004 RepID=A0A5C6CII9_9BACT|nr:glycosyltransferase family 39 protein [Novipirellula galeiformis]TWU23016.1 hypothetical protein Pla52o_25500 [Novipirellula galeiformis]